MTYITRLNETFELNEQEKEIYDKIKEFLDNVTDPDEVSNFIHSLSMKIFGNIPLHKRKNLPLQKIVEDMEAKKLIALGFARMETDEEINEIKSNNMREQAKGLIEDTSSKYALLQKKVPKIMIKED